MESLAFPGGKHVGIRPSSNPVIARHQALNLAMLFHTASFMRAAHTHCRVADEWRKLVKSARSRRDRQAYLNKCYPRFVEENIRSYHVLWERQSNGHLVVRDVVLA